MKFVLASSTPEKERKNGIIQMSVCSFYLYCLMKDIEMDMHEIDDYFLKARAKVNFRCTRHCVYATTPRNQIKPYMRLVCIVFDATIKY